VAPKADAAPAPAVEAALRDEAAKDEHACGAVGRRRLSRGEQQQGRNDTADFPKVQPSSRSSTS
jgi:hypothetical protein